MIYVASKAKHAQWWQSLQLLGLPIVASWIHADQEALDGAEGFVWSAHWQTCLQEAAAADVVLFVDVNGENQCGALIEIGAALAAGRQVFLVSRNFWSIEHHPRVTKFEELANAVDALRCRYLKRAGTTARRHS